MRARKIHELAAAGLTVLAGGCDVLLGLEHRELSAVDGGGTSTSSTSTSTSTSTGGAGGGASTSSSGTGGATIECVPGQKQCVGNLPQSCDGKGEWLSGAACQSYCSAGTCIDTPSCANLTLTCGSGGDESCCASPVVIGGMYNRNNDLAYPATVSDFRLDRFEITVGRFRAFVDAYDASPGSKPMSGVGAHPKISNSGWQVNWSANMAADQAALKTAVMCSSTSQTWTDAVGGNENKPINCLSWYEAFAFCAWDGGRLPTDAEWNYAAAGGSEQRQYPWSTPPTSVTIDSTYAVYSSAPILAVGSKSEKGDGRWMQADLAGGVWEWNLDWYVNPYATPSCDDCAVVLPGNASGRVRRGGGWANTALDVLSSNRVTYDPINHGKLNGARCARTP